MSNVTSVANAVRPEWLGCFAKCGWCGADNDVSYDPTRPLAASFRCGRCGMSGTVSPPFECMDRGAVMDAVARAGIDLLG